MSIADSTGSHPHPDGPEERPERGGMPMDRAVRVMKVLDVWEPGCSARDMRHVIRRLRAALTELEATIHD